MLDVYWADELPSLLRRCRGERRLPHYILPRHTWWHNNFRRNELKCPYQNQPPAISNVVHFLRKYRSIPGVNTPSSVNQMYALGLRKQIQILYYQTWGESPHFREFLMFGLHYWIISFLVCRCRMKSQTIFITPTCSPYYLWRQIRLALWPSNEGFETDLPLIHISLISYTYISSNLRVQTESPLFRVLKKVQGGYLDGTGV